MVSTPKAPQRFHRFKYVLLSPCFGCQSSEVEDEASAKKESEYHSSLPNPYVSKKHIMMNEDNTTYQVCQSPGCLSERARWQDNLLMVDSFRVLM